MVKVSPPDRDDEHLKIEPFLVPPSSIVSIGAPNFPSRVLLGSKLGNCHRQYHRQLLFNPLPRGCHYHQHHGIIRSIITVSGENLKKAESVLASQEGGDHCNHCGEGRAQVGGIPCNDDGYHDHDDDDDHVHDDDHDDGDDDYMS